VCFADVKSTDVNIDFLASNIDTIGDTLGVLLSVFEILLWGNIALGIGDCFLRGT